MLAAFASVSEHPLLSGALLLLFLFVVVLLFLCRSREHTVTIIGLRDFVQEACLTRLPSGTQPIGFDGAPCRNYFLEPEHRVFGADVRFEDGTIRFIRDEWVYRNCQPGQQIQIRGSPLDDGYRRAASA